MKARIFCASIASMLVFSSCAAGEADDYPSRQVRMVIPFPPGSSDTVARLLAEDLSKSLGQTFFIDNKPGASGTLGTNFVARSQPDGYTLLFPTCAHAISAVSFKDLPYNTTEDFSAVAQVAYSPMVMVANPSLPANTLKEFIALAKSKPGTLNYASNGPGSITSLGMLMFKGMTGVNITDIPYKGAGPSLVGLMAGEVSVMLAPLGAVSGFLQGKKLKALAIASPKRSPQAPQIPTVSESGVPGFVATCWYGVLAPHGTPPAVVARLEQAIEKAMKNPKLRQSVAALGIEPAPASSAEFDAYIRSEIKKWNGVFTEAGLTPQ